MLPPDADDPALAAPRQVFWVQSGLWSAVLIALAIIAVQYGVYAATAITFPYGLDYSEGLIWQQALWLGGPHLYGETTQFPFLVCDYPPLYLAAVRVAAWGGFDFLAAGRAVSVFANVATCVLIGAMVFRVCRLSCSTLAASVAGSVAGLLPLTLLPIISWSILMRVDTLALTLTCAGLYLACLSFRRPGLIYLALIAFVAAAFTKQNYLAGACAMFPFCLIRSPAHTIRAYSAGSALGLVLVGLLEWLTDGRFLRHIVTYAADTVDPAVALHRTSLWLAAYPVYDGLVVAALVVGWRHTLARKQQAGWRGIVALIREDDGCAWLGFLALYLLLTTAMLITAGKTGAADNYFLEWMCCWCLWIGWLVGHNLGPSRAAPSATRLALLMPVLILLQLWPIHLGLITLQKGQFSDERKAVWGALLARVRQIPGPLLSDDMVLVIQAGRHVEMEPGILLELAHTGQWDEQKLIDKLRAHYFGAVITAYDPGDPTFDERYLPATRSAMLAAYPRVEIFGDYRLRLPR